MTSQRPKILFEETAAPSPNFTGMESILNTKDHELEKINQHYLNAAKEERNAEELGGYETSRTALSTQLEKDILVGPLQIKQIVGQTLVLQREDGSIIDRGQLKENQNAHVVILENHQKRQINSVTLVKILPKEIHIKSPQKQEEGNSLPPHGIYFQSESIELAKLTWEKLAELFKNEQFWETRSARLPKIQITQTSEKKKFLEASSLLLDPSFHEAFQLITHPQKLCGVQGPPGTGKTQLLAHAICWIIQKSIESAGQPSKIIVAAKTHKAVDNLLLAINQTCKKLHQKEVVRTSITLAKKDKEKNQELQSQGIASLKKWPTKPKSKEHSCPWDEFHVIGCTMDSLIGKKSPLREFPADFLFLDEAGQVPTYTVAAAHDTTDNIVFAGDQKQLPPIFQACHSESGLAAESAMAFLEKSLPHRVVTLLKSHRLCLPLCQNIQTYFYPEIKLEPGHNHAAKLIEKSSGEIRQGTELLPCAALGHQKRNAAEQFLITHEILNLLENYLYQENPTCEPEILKPKDFCVLTPYNEQAAYIQNALHEQTGEMFTCGTIHRMQGQGRRIIISSLCSSDPFFLREISEWIFDPAMWNVTISRGMALCILCANPKAVAECEPKTLEGTSKKAKFQEILQEISKED